MAQRLIILFILCGHFLYSVNCSAPHQSSANVGSFLKHVSDDDLLNSDVNKVELLSLKLENYNLRIQSELIAMKEQLLREVKTNHELLDSKITTKCNEAGKNVVAAPPPTKKLASCTEAMRQDNGKYAESGVYELYLPEFLHHPFNVYCLRDPNGGEPWTIIQRRQSNDTDFYREWLDYERGFGDLNANFFLGLDKIHALTNSQTHELWFQLEDFESDKRNAKYDNFAIGNAQDKYELITLGQYSGTASDSFSSHRGSKFTTKDSDNDKADSNCAVLFKGAWWYKKCHDSNLNGLYLGGEYPQRQKGEGVVWHKWRGGCYSLKYAHMAIRPKYH